VDPLPEDYMCFYRQLDPIETNIRVREKVFKNFVCSICAKKIMKLVSLLHIEISVTWICFRHGLPMFLSVAEKLTSFFCNR
jgi:hypothetical protein